MARTDIRRSQQRSPEETKLTKKPKTHSAHSTALAYFQESCHKLFLHEIERRDLLKFSAFLRDEKEQSPRAVYNKFENVMTFLPAKLVKGLKAWKTKADRACALVSNCRM